jgi:hypothetical protein
MSPTDSFTQPHRFSRRSFTKCLVTGLALSAAGCTPLRFMLNPRPQRYVQSPELLRATLGSFVRTIIPGAEAADAVLSQVFTDAAYPFAPYAAFFAGDLDRRAAELFGEPSFAALPAVRRTAVVIDGLNSDADARELYNAAIYAAQVSFYAGIYDDTQGCSLIGFDGVNSGFPTEEYCYSADIPTAEEATESGNYF